MKSFTTLIGWLLLAAILIVPSFLFYNWWSANKKNEAAVQVPVQSVSTATIFAGAQDAPSALPPRTVQAAIPQAASTSALPVKDPSKPNTTPAAASPAAPGAASSAQVRQDGPIIPQATAAAVKSQSVPQSTAPVQGGAAPAVQAAVSTQNVSGSYFAPKSDRDPIMSPSEYRKIKEEENLRREAERQRELALNRQIKEAGGENRIQLQGIVGNSVIISGEIYTVGNVVHGVKILKIGANYVIGEYKGKRFRKVLQ